MISNGYKLKNKLKLQNAINLWTNKKNSAKKIYGNINKLDKSSIKNFSNLFKDKENFNSNISNWFK